MSDLRWEHCSDGKVPRDAVHGGWDANRGEPLYVGRAKFSGAINPGKVHPSHKCCYVPWGDDEHAVKDYEVLVNPGNNVHLEWEWSRNGQVPHNAVVGGPNPSGDYYVGRHSHKGDTLCGKVHTGKGCLYISHGGRSVTKNEYAVLVRK